ncbi:hypothetical protein UJ101_00748 [Flavobacteriaceae bacterium UJ101]|nr:hypothetical protein UJ101_00748 [Flavobacteriaceae bacterium UJ101]
MVSLGKSMMSQGGIIEGSYDKRILNFEMNKQSIEKNFDQVIDDKVQKITVVNTTPISIK